MQNLEANKDIFWNFIQGLFIFLKFYVTFQLYVKPFKIMTFFSQDICIWLYL